MRGNFRHCLSTWGEIVGPYKGHGIFLFLVLSLSAVVETLSLGSVMPLLNTIVQRPEQADQARLMGWLEGMPQETRLIVVSIVVLGLFFFRTLVTLAREYYAAFFTNGLRRMWSTRIFENFLYGDLLDVKKEKQGHVINTMINEPIYAAKGINAVVDGLVAILIVIGVVSFLLWLNPWVTLVALLIIAGGVCLLWRVSSVYSENVGKSRVEFNQMINHLIAEVVSGIRQVKVFSAEARAWNEMDEYVRRLMRMMNRFALFNAAPKAVGEFLVVVLMIGVLCLGHFVFHKDLGLLLPEMSVFALALLKLFSMGSLLLAKRMEIATYWPSVKLVHKNAARLPTEKVGVSSSPVTFHNNLSIRKVSFHFPGGPAVLSEFSCNMAKGQKIGLVGRSGAGKSTLCDILTKLLSPTSGDIFVDDRPFSEVDRYAWRQRIGYVSQEPFLFHASVRDNIKIGLPAATDEEVFRAAKAAQADVFIRELPAGYDTLVGGGGVGLSGGQKQRIALAQAFVRRPDILVLDEATSGLDAESEARIFESLQNDFADILIVLVTHRLSTLRWADTILFMEDGKIVEAGSFDDLYRQGGAFRALIDQGIGVSGQ